MSDTDGNDDFLRSKKEQYHVFQSILFWSTLITLATVFLVIIPVLVD